MVRSADVVHPGAWWVWAIGLAGAASGTTNPLLLGLLVAVVLLVVVVNDPDGLRSIRLYLWLAVAVVLIRVAFRVVLGASSVGTVLFILPEVPLPDLAAGIRLGGPVTLEGVLAAVYDALRLAVLLLCVGAANVLADPRRLLRSTPAALYELGTAVVLALTIAPQLVRSAGRVRRARRLRGDTRRGLRALPTILVPVLEDALDRSIATAAAMDVRGYGRTPATTAGTGHPSAGAATLLGGLCVLCVGAYGLLDGTTPALLGTPAVLTGVALVGVGIVLTGRRGGRTRYRPDRWGRRETAIAVVGVATMAVVLAGPLTSRDALFPSVLPLVWPELPLVPTLTVLLAAVTAALATGTDGRTVSGGAVGPGSTGVPR